GAYQLLYMGSVPAYAAVSQAVDQARQISGKGMGGLTNAVLRALARDGENRAVFPDPERDPVGYLSSWESHPGWLVSRWLERWEYDEVEALLRENNRVPPLYLRPIGIDEAEALDRLRRAGIAAESVGAGRGSLMLPRGVDPVSALEAVPGVIQDPAASLVVDYVDPGPDARVADLCAAPGGKALALAGKGAYVLAADRSAGRLRRLRENALRIGSPVAIVAARAEAPALASADVVLLDVPCSGTGTLARHPDIRWRLRPADLKTLAAIQARILEGGAGIVKRGGLLVYSSCTLEPEENEDQIEAFLERHPEFQIEAPATVPSEFLDATGYLRVLPHLSGFDGAFAARLRRVS
ncbi:MAG: transcription antitermination factor NusB, partial [Gemmatimonadota bacterium]